MPTLPRPPYSSATHSQPAINVNLSPCNCEGVSVNLVLVEPHTKECAGQPVLIPCPIQRSVTFEVVLGTCFCTTGDLRDMPQDSGGDLHICPARPIRVSCFIDGEAWPETEVGEIDVHESQNPSAQDTERILAACRERWALVKALVLGRNEWTGSAQHCILLGQRDTVFAALADMARAEEAAYAAQARIAEVAGTRVERFHAQTAEMRPSASWLALYVERLIEQAGVAS